MTLSLESPFVDEGLRPCKMNETTLGRDEHMAILYHFKALFTETQTKLSHFTHNGSKFSILNFHSM